MNSLLHICAYALIFLSFIIAMSTVVVAVYCYIASKKIRCPFCNSKFDADTAWLSGQGYFRCPECGDGRWLGHLPQKDKRKRRRLW